MPEIKPDTSDESRCISVHWTLAVQCVLPRTHRENWHEAWHPESGNRIRYRRNYGIYRTEELRDGGWRELEIPPPGEVCGEPHADQAGVFCQYPRTHNEFSWTHRALFEGCQYTWNTLRREPTPVQVAVDLIRARQIASSALAERDAALDHVRRIEAQRDAAARAVRSPDLTDAEKLTEVREALAIVEGLRDSGVTS